MLFMNEYEIDDAFARTQPDTTTGKAVRFLSAFRHEVNAHSDGWPYWNAPVKSAAQLMTLIKRAIDWRDPKPITETELKRALTPIKAFYTRRGYAAGMKLPEL